MTRDEMKTVREGDLIVRKFKLKDWKRAPSLVVDVIAVGRVLIMNPVRGLVEIHLDMWEFVYEDR